MFGGYVDIYRRKKYVGGATRTHEDGGHAHGGRPAPCLVASSVVS